LKQYLETLIKFDGSEIITRRPTNTSKANNQRQVLPDTDSEKEKTPMQGDVQQIQNFVIDADHDEDEDEDNDNEPFETPIALRKTKEQALKPVSDIEETSETEEVEREWVGTDKQKNKNRAVDRRTGLVSLVIIDNNSGTVDNDTAIFL
jgi:hypothetical protein